MVDTEQEDPEFSDTGTGILSPNTEASFEIFLHSQFINRKIMERRMLEKCFDYIGTVNDTVVDNI